MAVPRLRTKDQPLLQGEGPSQRRALDGEAGACPTGLQAEPPFALPPRLPVHGVLPGSRCHRGAGHVPAQGQLPRRPLPLPRPHGRPHPHALCP